MRERKHQQRNESSGIALKLWCVTPSTRFKCFKRRETPLSHPYTSRMKFYKRLNYAIKKARQYKIYQISNTVAGKISLFEPGSKQFYVHGGTPRNPQNYTTHYYTIVTLRTPREGYDARHSIQCIVAATPQRSPSVSVSTPTVSGSK